VYGNPRGLTPFLDELARKGTVFANAYAPSSWTCPSVASLFTSRYGSQHRVDSFEAVLADSEVTLAEILARQGYATAGFSANLRMMKTLGYAQGFDDWEVYMGRQTGGVKPRGSYLRRDSLAWLRGLQRSPRRRPAFVYFQYMEPHTPYQPVEPYHSRFVSRRDGVDESVAQTKLTQVGLGRKGLSDAEVEVLSSLYDGEVASVDAEIRALFAELEQIGFLQHAVIVITADHGEEFGEHGEMLHGFTLYNGAIHIPLVIVAPGVDGGRVVNRNVSLVDVAPTLLELVGAAPAPTFEGHSLVPLMRNPMAPAALWSRLTGGSDPPDVISEIEPLGGNPVDLRLHARAIIRGAQKLVVTPQDKTTLYDLSTDPGEMQPLPGDTQAAAMLLERLTARRSALQQHIAGSPERQPLDDATREKLRALGYQH
jgi:arylsulfatase A-like enzyme